MNISAYKNLAYSPRLKFRITVHMLEMRYAQFESFYLFILKWYQKVTLRKLHLQREEFVNV